jgi:hypothetical protein
MLTDTPLNPATDSSNAKERAAAHSEDVLVYRNILVPVDFPRIRKKQSRTRLSWLQATMRRCTCIVSAGSAPSMRIRSLEP